MPDPPFLPTSVVEPGQDLTGTTVSRFAIRARVGTGGMGEVYQADDTQLHRTVALKRVAPHLRTDTQFRFRLLKEAERAAQLTDPHIASLYDVLEEKGELFLVMEFVEGETLRERLERPINLDETLALAMQCAEALVAAHEKGIVHRDLKPENIMITAKNQVKILDFGVARRMRSGVGETPTESLESALGVPPSGTPAYMAPEVLLERESDGRADIFSLGIVLYESLAGRHPFRAPSVIDTADRILHEEPDAVSKFNPRVPADLDRSVSKMLAKDPAERYASAADLLVDLRAAQRGVAARVWRIRPLPLRRSLGLAGALVATLGVAFLSFAPSLRERTLAWFELSPVPSEKRLAVLAFTNVGGELANQSFCDGLVETLTSKLTQLEQFQGSLCVIPATDVREREVRSAEQAHKAFGVNLVLTGSVQRAEGRVRLTANLVDAKTLRQLRSTVIDARIMDVAVWQDDVIVQLARMLQLELEPEARRLLAAGGTIVPSAYDFYLQGRGYLQRHERMENLDNAIHLFQQALQQDPRYALAHAGLAEAYWRKYALAKERHWMERAQQSSRRAVELDDQAPTVRVTLGLVYAGTGRYEEAVEQFRWALKLDPVNPDAHRELARAYEAMGRLEEAETTYQKAIELRPSYWASYQYLGRFYYRHGRYQEAAQQFQQVIELTPDNRYGYDSLGGLYHLMGRTDEAIVLLEKSLAIEPTAYAYSNIGTLYFFQGRYGDAVRVFEKASELEPKSYLVRGNLADAYRWAPDQREKSLAVYRQAIALARDQLRVNPRDPELNGDIALYWAKLGESQRALEAMRVARKEAPRDVNLLFESAVVFHLAGQDARALQMLESAAEAGYSLAEIRAEPELARLRAHPHYQALIQGSTAKPVASRSDPTRQK